MTFTNCPECGTPLKWQDANHPTQCPNCGYSFNNNTTTQNENSKKNKSYKLVHTYINLLLYYCRNIFLQGV